MWVFGQVPSMWKLRDSVSCVVMLLSPGPESHSLLACILETEWRSVAEAKLCSPHPISYSLFLENDTSPPLTIMWCHYDQSWPLRCEKNNVGYFQTEIVKNPCVIQFPRLPFAWWVWTPQVEKAQPCDWSRLDPWVTRWRIAALEKCLNGQEMLH